MKKLRYNRGAKAAAVILLATFAMLFALSGLCIIWGDELNVYSSTYSTVYSDCINNRAETLLHEVYAEYFYHYGYGINFDSEPNFSYSVYSGGEELYSTWDGGDARWIGLMADDELKGYVRRSSFTENSTSADSITHLAEEYIKNGSNIVMGYVPMRLNGNSNMMRELNIMSMVYSMRYTAIAVAVVSLVLGILLFVFLMRSAGVKNAEGEIQAGFFDKIPYDVYTFVLGIVFMFLLGGIFSLADRMHYSLNFITTFLFMGLCFLAAGLILLAWFMSTAVRIKLKVLFKNTLCCRLLAWLGRKLRGSSGLLNKALSKLPMLWRYVAILAALVIIDFIFVSYHSYGVAHGQRVWLLRTVIYVPAVLYFILCFKRLREGTKAIVSGDENAVIDTKYLYGEVKAEAEDLNNIRAGLSKAVDERMKSERFKTELITNVSHDIKTPLTSIINYTDLLSKEEPENEKMREYIEVISRQSDKLKKLIEDLIDASKASTGALKVELVRTELGVLLEQTQGEYEDKLRNADLELVVSKPASPLYIMGDSRHMWRIFDNLMNNIVKYAQHGTRIYLSAENDSGSAVITFRNISAEPLNIPAEKLMERFVRGDASRHSSGSGLGLSIANSLAELQGGSMELCIDGDLFKVILRFPAV